MRPFIPQNGQKGWKKPVIIKDKLVIATFRGIFAFDKKSGEFLYRVSDFTVGDAEARFYEKALPDLKGTLKPGEYYNIKLAWNQTDFSGKPVPPGGYGVFLKPGLIHYADSCGDNYFQVVHDTMTTQTGLTVDNV